MDRQLAHLAKTVSHPAIRLAAIGDADRDEPTVVQRLLFETRQASLHADAESAAGDIPLRLNSTDFKIVILPGVEGAEQSSVATPIDAAICVVDCTEDPRGQIDKLSSKLLRYGIRQIVVAVNNMDRVAYDAGQFRRIETEIVACLKDRALKPEAVIPVSVRDGVGITEHTYTFEWFRPTLVEALTQLTPRALVSETRGSNKLSANHAEGIAA